MENWVYDPCKTAQLTSQWIEQKQNKEQRSHLHLGQKGKTIGCYCSFYTEYEPKIVKNELNRLTKSEKLFKLKSQLSAQDCWECKPVLQIQKCRKSAQYNRDKHNRD